MDEACPACIGSVALLVTQAQKARRSQAAGRRRRTPWLSRKPEKVLDKFSGAVRPAAPDARQNARCGPPERRCSVWRAQHDSGSVSAPPRASTAVSLARKTAWYNDIMQTEILSSLARLSDSDLVARVKNLAGRERKTMAEIIAHLGEIEARDLYAREGYRSLFEFCRDTFWF